MRIDVVEDTEARTSQGALITLFSFGSCLLGEEVTGSGTHVKFYTTGKVLYTPLSSEDLVVHISVWEESLAFWVTA